MSERRSGIPCAVSTEHVLWIGSVVVVSATAYEFGLLLDRSSCPSGRHVFLITAFWIRTYTAVRDQLLARCLAKLPLEKHALGPNIRSALASCSDRPSMATLAATAA